uniref:EF-hand domain-containing protein n=1 Tax=Alexandrium catenella TaxID=2925 RepID=A0A7S1QTU2_ALECA
MFSVIVAQAASTPVAPVEVSCGCGRTAEVESPVIDLDMVPFTEGVAGWHDDQSKRLTKVPEWMLGATLVRAPFCGPPAGAIIAVRPVAPSVVYVVVEDSSDGRPGRNGGLLPSVLPGSGWEPRQDAPEWSEGSKLTVYAKRVTARDVLCVPTIAEEGAAFFLVVKLDLEAFDASVETNLGLEYCRAPMAETAAAWSDKQHRWAWVPTFMNGGILFRGPHDSTPTGTTLRVSASGAFRAYVILEADYKGGHARSGGFLESLPAAGWRVEKSAPSWGDIASTMEVFSIKANEGSSLLLPPTTSKAVFALVVVSVASSPDRLAEEMKRSFRAWDTQGVGGIRKEDLGALLAALCPSLAQPARDELLAWADRTSMGVVAYEEFVDRLLLAGPAA